VLLLALLTPTTTTRSTTAALSPAHSRSDASDSPGFDPADVVASVNQARASVGASDMLAVSWNYDLEALIRVNATRNPEWFFEPNTRYTYPIRGNTWGWNGMTLMEYPAYAAFKKQGWTYLFHDTNCGARCIPTIFKFRLNQDVCFSYANCAAARWDQFETCASALAGGASASPTKRPTSEPTGAPTTPRPHKGSSRTTHSPTSSSPTARPTHRPTRRHLRSLLPKSDPCNWWWQYYPWLVRSDLAQVACAELPVPGPADLHDQPGSFFCYAVVTAPIDSDVPFLEGEACSKCPEGYECGSSSEGAARLCVLEA